MRKAVNWMVAGLGLALLGCVTNTTSVVTTDAETTQAEISCCCGDTGLVKADAKADNKGSEWTHWRGPLQNGVAFETNLPDKFSADPEDKNNLVWKSDNGSRCNP